MAYSSGMLLEIVMIQNQRPQTSDKYGLGSGGLKWEDVCEVHAAVDYVKGMRAMREGALDVYEVKMVRMRWNEHINERSRIVWDGKIYQVLGDTFHANRHTDTIQFNAVLVINDTVQPSSSSFGLGNVPAQKEIG